MAWVELQYSKRQIDAAGDDLIRLPAGDPRREAALEKINNWRSCHSYPLLAIKNTLAKRAKAKVSSNALIAQRIKRMSSIALKLKQNSAMKLSKMQDIGGCRAVLNSINEVEKLVEVYDDALAKHPAADDRPLRLHKHDYVATPKPDGYRGIHLIMRFQSLTKTAYNGQRIEIQIRSKLQHAWATAVETCQTFTGQALKAKIKDAQEEWLLFFRLMSSAIAISEKRPVVPGTPTHRRELKAQLREIVRDLNIITLLEGWNMAMKRYETVDDGKSAAFLLDLNISDRTLRMEAFKESEMMFAHARYLAREKETENDSNIQVVLVSADSVSNLKRAYPNYYVDTTAFIAAVKQAIS